MVADFIVEDPGRFAHDFGLHVSSMLGQAKVEGIVAEKLEAALQKQEAVVLQIKKVGFTGNESLKAEHATKGK